MTGTRLIIRIRAAGEVIHGEGGGQREYAREGKVKVTQRERNNRIKLLVTQAMILCNTCPKAWLKVSFRSLSYHKTYRHNMLSRLLGNKENI